jgi:biotin carboxylase
MPRVLLLMSTRTYRARAFMVAARRLGVDLVVGSEQRQALAGRMPNMTLALDFRRPDRAARKVANFARQRPFDAVVGVDDDSTLVAAHAARALGLPHNSVDSVRLTRDKYKVRRALAEAGLPSPDFKRFALDDDPRLAASRVAYPCVLKPVALAASRGVIRADNAAEFVRAFDRIAAMLAREGGQPYVVVERFVPGPEVALEGLLTDGELRVLAMFDKPDPLDGPFFEETIYVTPSRLPEEWLAAVADVARRAANALGLRNGPLHAELRLGPGGPYLIDLAARSIGGLCSQALRFGTGSSLEAISLEEILIRHAIGELEVPPARESRAAGAMMLPIPKGGTLMAVRGRDEALNVLGIEDVAITIPLGQPVVPLPEGDRYLGFIFARGQTPAFVEQALREAHRRLGFVIVAADEEPDESDWLPATPTQRLLRVLPSAAGTGGRSRMP